MLGSSSTDDAYLEKIELSASVHLSLCELELGDPVFRLFVVDRRWGSTLIGALTHCGK